MSLESQMNVTNVAADDIKDYASETVNNGYEGTIEVALLPEQFETDILGDVGGVENSETRAAEFAVLVEFTGDQKKGRYCFWRCQLTKRPTISQRTKDENFTIDTDTLNIKAMPRLDDYNIKGRCYEDWDVYENFYSAVPDPDDFTAASYATVTQTLTHAASSFAGTQTKKGEAFTATLTESVGYAMGTVTVTMGGTDITSTAYNSETGVITIAEVTGNIVITATAST
jgi:phi13 family phage major tail protein